MQLNLATETAVRVMVELARERRTKPMTLRELATKVGGSRANLAKIVGALVRSRLLRSRRGALGGVELVRAPGEVTLLEIVEAVEGQLGASYCSATPDRTRVCGFHAAMVEVREAMLGVLGRWTLEALTAERSRAMACRMRCAGGSTPRATSESAR